MTHPEHQPEIHFSTGSGSELLLTADPGVFRPTGTTLLLLQAVKKKILEPTKLLDLGCGTGVVGVALHLHGLVKAPLCASDVSQSAVRCSRINFDRYGCNSDVRCGSLFEPWRGQQFDVIVDDISGVAQDIAIASPWFDGVPCETGRDGTILVIKILREAPNYLTNGGRFFFPVLSLSNADLLLQTANENFNSVEMVARLEWPLPPELFAYLPLLKELEKEGSIKLLKRFGMVLCYTEIYCATNT